MTFGGEDFVGEEGIWFWVEEEVEILSTISTYITAFQTETHFKGFREDE